MSKIKTKITSKEKSPPKKSSGIFLLGPKSDSDSVEDERKFKKMAKERRICARCLIQSDGKIEREVLGSHCDFCGAKWAAGK